MARLGVKIAKQNSKGAPKDGGFRDVSPRKSVGSQYTNPSKAKGLKIPQK